MLVPEDNSQLLEEIKELIEAPAPAQPDGYLEKLEHTLTDGYATALALEAERWRLERKIGDVARKLGDPSSELGPQDLASLAKKMSAADSRLTHLRGMLSSLRDRANEARATAA